MRVMTYNIQHGQDQNDLSRIDLLQIARIIRDYEPVFCTLNEVRDRGTHSEYTDQVKTICDYLGWNGFFAQATLLDNGNPYGNAIVSSVPILETEVIPIPDPPVRKYDGYYETRCLLRAVLDVGQPFTVFASHFGLNPDEAENAVTTVIDAVSRCNTPFCFQGDLNLKPNDPLLLPLYAVMTDTAEKADGPIDTWVSPDVRQKIDYIFVSKDVMPLRFRVPAIIASDHYPCYAEIRLG